MSTNPKKPSSLTNTPAKGAIKKTAAGKPAPKGVPARPTTPKNTPAKPNQKAAAPAKKAAPKKTAPTKKDKDQGEGFFSKLFGIFKKKTPETAKSTDEKVTTAPIGDIKNEELLQATTSTFATDAVTPTPETLEITNDFNTTSTQNINSEEIESVPISQTETLIESPIVKDSEEIVTTKEEEIVDSKTQVTDLGLEEKPIEETINEIPSAEPIEESPIVTQQTTGSPIQLQFPDDINQVEEEHKEEDTIIEQNHKTEEPVVENNTNESIDSSKEEAIASETTASESSFEPIAAHYTKPISENNTTYSRTSDDAAINYSEPTKEKSNTPSSIETTMNKEKEEKKKKRGILIPLLIASLIGNVVLALLWKSENNKVKEVIVLQKEVIVEKDNVMKDLLKLKEEYAGLQTNNVDLQKELDAKRAEIDKLIESAKKHQNDGFIISKLKKETETLRKIMIHYVHEIDSLNTLNQKIIAEKNKVSQDLNTQINKTEELEKAKDALIQTVNKGSILKALSPSVLAVRMRGGVKEVEVNRAARTEKLKVSFTLGANAIAKKGVRIVYIRITAPNGREITVSENEQNYVGYDGTRGFFAEKSEVDYQGIDTPVDVFCGNPVGFVTGKYSVFIICDGTVIGQTEIMLK